MSLFQIKLLPIDFNKSWWKILFRFIPAYIFIVSAEIIINVLNVFTPLWWAKSFSNLEFDLFLQIFIIWISISLLDYITRLAYNRFQIRIINSLQYSVHNRLITADSNHHLKNSQGILFSKIDRGISCFRDLLDSVTFGILPTVVRTITVLVSLVIYASSIASTIAVLILVIIVLNAFLNWRILRPLEKNLIIAQDTLKSRFMSYINNIQLIKTTLAVTQIDHNLKELNYGLLKKEKNFWDINATLYMLMYFIYLTTVFILGTYMFNLIKYHGFSAPFAIALLGAYIKGTQGILKIERPIRTVIKAIIAITDFFDYILSFDNSNKTLSVARNILAAQHLKDTTSPIQNEKQLHESNTCFNIGKEITSPDINVYFNNVSFTYNNFFIFDNFNLKISVDSKQQNKIFGITGPSGIGKSTFAALLAGQLKPNTGSIKINTHNIYELNDLQRQKLIALQIQTNTLLDDTLKNNLLLGLPDNTYSNEQLIDILTKFELNQILVYGDGLSNYLGNNGYKLSSGQREKIAFINLYLRAQYFKPMVIILDEPTSHLDAKSEDIINDMIIQLSQNSLVILISHKASMLAKAITVIDFSLNNYAPMKMKTSILY